MTTRRSLFFSFIDRYASLLITVASSMVLARLLTPNEIGVYSVTMVLLIFVNTFRDLNAGQFLVQKQHITDDHIRAVWTIQLGLGLGFATLVALAAYPVAQFYGEPRMSGVMYVVALNYAFNPLGSITNAWLVREMRFQTLAIIGFVSTALGALVSLTLAWFGNGPISLAFGSLASILSKAVLSTWYRPKSFPWLPGTTGIREVLSFGGKLTGSSFVSSLATNSPEMLLGKLQDLTAVGYFSRSNGLLQMFNRLFVDAILSVCMPWFSRQIRSGEALSAPFLKATSYLTAIGWTFCISAACLAYPATELLYGSQWRESVNLTRILALAMAFTIPSVLCRSALLAASHVNEVVRVTVLTSVVSVCIVLIGCFFGLLGVGVALVISAMYSTFWWLRATFRFLQVELRTFGQALLVSLKVALLASVVPVAVCFVWGLRPLHIIAPLSIGVIGCLMMFVVAVLYFNHPLRVEMDELQLKFKGRGLEGK